MRPLTASHAALALAWSLAWASTLATAAPDADPRGRWITASGNLEVEIAPCGAAWCGTVTKVLANRSMSRDGGEMAPVDARPALGMTILKDFVRAAPDDATLPPTEWLGEIYNRENGRTYRCQMSLAAKGGQAGAHELVLHAYVGLPWFGKTQRWQRVATEETGHAQR